MLINMHDFYIACSGLVEWNGSQIICILHLFQDAASSAIEHPDQCGLRIWLKISICNTERTFKVERSFSLLITQLLILLFIVYFISIYQQFSNFRL